MSCRGFLGSSKAIFSELSFSLKKTRHSVLEFFVILTIWQLRYRLIRGRKKPYSCRMFYLKVITDPIWIFHFTCRPCHSDLSGRRFWTTLIVSVESRSKLRCTVNLMETNLKITLTECIKREELLSLIKAVD